LKWKSPALSIMKNVPSIVWLEPSFSTRRVKCFYYLKVTLDYDSYIGEDSKPRIYIPFFLHHEDDNEILNQVNDQNVPMEDNIQVDEIIDYDCPVYASIEPEKKD